MNVVRPKIDIGYHVGILTVTDRTEKRVSGYTVWRCLCECGGEVELDTRCLQRGSVTDCGCSSAVRPGMLDMSGMRFGMLVALEPTEERSKDGSAMWLCQCDCGNVCTANSSQLRSGQKKSCGCLRHPALKDYIGKRFGQLTVLAYEEKRAGMHRWRCRCDCGRETVVGQTLLQTGKTKSCGCLQSTVILNNAGHLEGTSVKALEYYRTHLNTRNTSGHTGVYKNAKSDKWIAQITFRRKTYYLGSYTDLEDAVDARKKAEAMHDEFLEWYYEKYPDRKRQSV